MGKRAGVAVKKVILWVLGILALAAVVLGVWLGPAIADFARAGFFEKAEKRTWHADTRGNLQAIQTALKITHDSDGVYPKAEGWADAIKKRVRTEDLSKSDADKKFIDPDVPGGKGFFAYNEAAADKYIDDLPKKGDTIIVFQATETGWNVHGDPAKIGRPSGLGITADGKIVELGKDGS